MSSLSSTFTPRLYARLSSLGAVDEVQQLAGLAGSGASPNTNWVTNRYGCPARITLVTDGLPKALERPGVRIASSRACRVAVLLERWRAARKQRAASRLSGFRSSAIAVRSIEDADRQVSATHCDLTRLRLANAHRAV
jgi:hypothetical protein